MGEWFSKITKMGSLAQGVTAIAVLLFGAFAFVVVPAINMGNYAKEAFRNVELISAELIDPNTGETLRAQMNRMEDTQSDMRGEMTRMANRISLYFEDASYGFFVCDEVGRNIEVNRTYARMLAVGKGDLIDYGWRNYVMSEELPSYDDQWSAAFQEYRELTATRVTFKRADTGRLVTGIVNIYPFFENPEANLFLGRIEWERESGTL